MKSTSGYLEPRSRYGAQLGLLACALLIGAGILGWQAQAQRQAADKLALRNQTLRAAQAVAPTQVSRPAAAEAKHWEALRVEREFPWPDVLVAIERAAKADVELLEFQPDKQNRRVVLSGEARDRKALASYLEALSAQPALHHVHLTHQQSLLRDRLETVEFEIKAGL